MSKNTKIWYKLEGHFGKGGNMKSNIKSTKREIILNRNRTWKQENEEYIRQLQFVLDRIDNIPDQDLKKSIIYETLKCDEILTKISEKLFQDYYLKGYKEAKSKI